MLHAIDAIVFVVLAYTVLMAAAQPCRRHGRPAWRCSCR